MTQRPSYSLFYHCSNDFNGVASVLKLPEHFVARVSVDNQGRVLYDDFVAVYNSYFDDSDSYRPGVRSSNRYLYSKQGQVPLRSEAVDNSGKKERKEVRWHDTMKPINHIIILLSCFTYYISEMSSFNGRNLYH